MNISVGGGNKNKNLITICGFNLYDKTKSDTSTIGVGGILFGFQEAPSEHHIIITASSSAYQGRLR